MFFRQTDNATDKMADYTVAQYGIATLLTVPSATEITVGHSWQIRFSFEVLKQRHTIHVNSRGRRGRHNINLACRHTRHTTNIYKDTASDRLLSLISNQIANIPNQIVLYTLEQATEAFVQLRLANKKSISLAS